MRESRPVASSQVARIMLPFHALQLLVRPPCSVSFNSNRKEESLFSSKAKFSEVIATASGSETADPGTGRGSWTLDAFIGDAEQARFPQAR